MDQHQRPLFLQIDSQKERLRIEDGQGRTDSRVGATSCCVVDGALNISTYGSLNEVIAAGAWRRYWKETITTHICPSSTGGAQ
ncbi:MULTISPECIES: hypothetical protein [unclassified Hydrogenophaga]|uniref:hypothetical protein n=1 Tax=unclassified Hydrogenophaga TaxID=2610897 RepID=UPI00132034C5|nr:MULTISPECIES: hypothetical protein [unclassified Hydrogenophaga]QHE78703.1 hypothetical protein F9Z45_21465 [Hydrogenophaga sp. PBL-H3]QHE83128.1 hypothetical protein F9Z44_21465 [Hydrogenophaga sp. PBL-H3]